MDDADVQGRKEQLEARIEQLEGEREQAAARRLAAAVEAEAIHEAAAAAASGDPQAITAAAVELHRAHALHEAKAGHPERARASLERAGRAAARLVRLRRG